jgi:hypothetical protein
LIVIVQALPRRFTRYLTAGLWTGLVLLGGCREAGPPLVPVSGLVTYRGKPLPRGTVSLRPTQAGAWDQPTGSIDASGRYVVYTQGRKGAPPGDYVVVVMATDAPAANEGAAHPTLPQSIIPARYGDPAVTPLRIKARPGSATSFELELTDDASP